MLCIGCQAIMSNMPGGYQCLSGRTQRDQLTVLLCSRCGAVLPNPDPDYGLLAKLTQLSRFGLGADDRPLLARAGRTN